MRVALRRNLRALTCCLSYIIAPTAASVEAVRSDMRRNMYSPTITICTLSPCSHDVCRYGAYHINFLSRSCPRSMLPCVSPPVRLRLHPCNTSITFSIVTPCSPDP